MTSVRYLAALIAGLVLPSMLVAQRRLTIDDRPLMILAHHSEEFLRIVGAMSLSDSGFVVADEGALQLLFFARDGRPAGRIGRGGAGPGEFRMMVWLGSCAPNAVSIYDPAAARITDVGLSDRTIRTRPASVVVGANGKGRTILPYGLACAPNGAFGAVGGPSGVSATLGPYRPLVDVGVSRAGPGLVSLGKFPGTERYRYAKSEGPRFFGRPTIVAASQTRVFVGTADSFHVQIFGYDGKALGALRHANARKPLTVEDRETWLQRNLDRLGGRMSAFSARASLLRRGVLPEMLPAYERFLVEGERLWVEEAWPPTAETRTWWGFDELGRVFARLRVPSALTILEFDGDTVLGKWTDAEGVESIRKMRLLEINE